MAAMEQTKQSSNSGHPLADFYAALHLSQVILAGHLLDLTEHDIHSVIETLYSPQTAFLSQWRE
jgi:hypothetical protein